MDEATVSGQSHQTPTTARPQMYSLWMIGVLIVFVVCEGFFFIWGDDAIGYAFLGLFLAIVFCLIRSCRVFPSSVRENIIVILLILFILVILFLPAISAVREAARRCYCMNNLRQLGLALYNYEDMYGQFPPAFVADEKGKPMHSWRTLILPQLDEKTLYDRYDFEKPWNASENQKLVMEATPDVFRCPSVSVSADLPENRTDYVAVLGEDTFWRPDGTPRKEDEITGGLSNTIALIEINRSDIPWQEPRDVKLDDFLSGKLSWNESAVHAYHSAFYEYQRGRNVVFADGSVRYIEGDLTPKQLRRLFSITNPIDWEKFDFRDEEPRPIVYRFVVFYIWLATLVMQFLYIFFPVKGRKEHGCTG